MGVKRTKDEIKQIVINVGYEFLDSFSYPYKATYVIVRDINGYKYNILLNSVINNNNMLFVGKNNPYSLENISIWLNKNNKTFELCQDNVYNNSYRKLKFHCFICEEDFYASWNNISKNRTCSICSGRKVGKKTSLTYLRPELLKEFSSKNDFTTNDVTIGTHRMAIWKCCICGHEWCATINSRTNSKSGCPACSGRVVTNKTRLSILYPEIAKEWHPTKNGKLTSNDVSYGSEKNIWWLCSICEHEWKTLVLNRSHGWGCPKCSLSKGEKKIFRFLDKNNIGYIPQFRFDNCRNIYSLPFDFYLSNFNICIEYHGKQHYEPKEFFGGEKKLIKRRQLDKIKFDYCENNEIDLLIIPYWDFNNIETILANKLLIK